MKPTNRQYRSTTLGYRLFMGIWSALLITASVIFGLILFEQNIDLELIGIATIGSLGIILVLAAAVMSIRNMRYRSES